MKKLIILFVMAMFLIATDAFAYQIITEDTRVYEFENGKKSQDGVKYNQTYEVDGKEGTLTLKGTDQVYTIIYKKNGNLTATRIRYALIAYKKNRMCIFRNIIMLGFFGDPS